MIANQKFEELHNISENPLEDFINMAYNAGVEVYEDLHYRKGSKTNT
jgi:predicted peroxiredoxin